MSLQFQAVRPSRRSTGNPLHVVAFFALLPFGFVGGVMLIQILGSGRIRRNSRKNGGLKTLMNAG